MTSAFSRKFLSILFVLPLVAGAVAPAHAICGKKSCVVGPGGGGGGGGGGYGYDGNAAMMGAFGSMMQGIIGGIQQGIEQQERQNRATAKNFNDAGVRQFNVGNYEGALQNFLNAQRYSPGDPNIQGNIVAARKKVAEIQAERERRHRADMAAAQARIGNMLDSLAAGFDGRGSASDSLSFEAPAGTSFFGTGGGGAAPVAVAGTPQTPVVPAAGQTARYSAAPPPPSGNQPLQFIAPDQPLFSKRAPGSAPVDLRPGPADSPPPPNPASAGRQPSVGLEFVAPGGSVFSKGTKGSAPPKLGELGKGVAAPLRSPTSNAPTGQVAALPSEVPPPKIRRNKHALIEGTTRIIGHNAPDTLDPAERAEAEAKLADLLRLAGKDPAEVAGFSEYEFILGVGKRYQDWQQTDLVGRVYFGDEFNNGSKSTTQPLYPSLKGRAFTHMDCHSNGAMVCLAALERGDVQAGHVRLFGPQITPESAEHWQKLVETGKIRSLQVVINEGDYIPRVSYAFSFQAMPTTAGRVLISDKALVEQLRQRAPGMQVKLTRCPERGEGLRGLFTTACHGLDVYWDNVGR